VKRWLILLALVAAAATAWHERARLLALVPTPLLPIPPHDQYATALVLTGLASTDAGRAWTAAAEHALAAAEARPPQGARTMEVPREGAAAWRFPIRRGQRVTIDVGTPPDAVFLDLFLVDGNERVASAPARSATLTYVSTQDGDLIARVQRPLTTTPEGLALEVGQRVEASLRFPVQGLTGRAVQSGFGVARDSGRRRHEGIDIFAPRGTPVVAAAGGWVTRQTSNRLGGNVVWLWAPSIGASLYYAHLDSRAVQPGERVDAGDVVGHVGNTGNARGTAPHLHFGVYATLEGAVDPLPFVVDPVPSSTRAE
jgi:murein DD-endopeptidase MepM/ murein hydrolase activator NlpD